MVDSPQQSRALSFMLIGAAIIGSNGLMVRLAGTPPTVSAFWRMLFAGVLLLVYARATGRWRTLPARAWLWALVPAVAFAADLWLWHRSILIVGPGLSTLLANAQVFFMALAGVAFFGERLGARFVGGLAFACLGLWLMLGGHWDALPAQYRWGVWLGLGTGVCYAAYNLGLRRAQHEADADPRHPAPIEQTLAIASLGSALCLGIAGAVQGDAFAIPTWHAFAVLLTLALVGHCVSWALISRAMRHLRVAVIGLLLLLQPIVAFVLDVWIFDRATSPREWLGLGFTLTGIFLAGLRGRRSETEAAPET